MAFKLNIPFPPAGDQPAAIQQLTEGVLDGEKYQTLLVLRVVVKHIRLQT